MQVLLQVAELGYHFFFLLFGLFLLGKELIFLLLDREELIPCYRIWLHLQRWYPGTLPILAKRYPLDNLLLCIS